MHRITYRDTFSTWDEALPAGNGRFGMMGYCDRHEGLTFVFNHYDVYYRPYLPRVQEDTPYAAWCGDLEAVTQRALAAHADPGHPAHNNYTVVMNPETAVQYGVDRPGAAMMIAGLLRFRTAAPPAAVCTELAIEEAEITCRLDGLEVRGVVARDDVAIFTVRQDEPGLLAGLSLDIPPNHRHLAAPRLRTTGESDFCLEAAFYPDGEDRERFPPCRFGLLLHLDGARGTLRDGGVPEIALEAEAREFAILVTVATGEAGDGYLEEARGRLAAADLPALRTEHRRYWQAFWTSGIELPDALLETLWHLHLYALACCSGEGARAASQACGLNGLWDIRTPSQWGSFWYWDVNIQEAFWPVHTANHPELALPFFTGLATYLPQAMAHARQVYGSDGIAGDYPFTYYHCIWPWCAQFAAWHVRCTGDLEFLREYAYPLYRGILRFFADIMTGEDGRLALFPTVSPEQGPMTRNSTITLSCIRFVLEAAIEANALLGEDAAEARAWREMQARLPDYPAGDHPAFGPIFKDSEWAPVDLYLAHGSPLMPVYPARQIGAHSDPAIRERAINTWRYAHARQSIGTHNFVWLACAAARLGLGAEALASLYDLGIGFQMRANGMFAEETERWMQNCLVASAPVFSPPLVEAGSGTVAAINEMLLQSAGGAIEVFPAVPDGRDVRIAGEQRFGGPEARSGGYPLRWDDCAFHRLLAEGAFEVSARLAGGRVTEVEIVSLQGNRLTLADPFPPDRPLTVLAEGRPAPVQRRDGLISLSTAAGGTYRFSVEGAEAPPPRAAAMPLVRQAATRRRVFLGKDAATDYLRALDGMTHDYFAGDQPVSPVTRYKFDFTAPGARKDYAQVLPGQYHGCGKQGVRFLPVTLDTLHRPGLPFGWDSADGLTCVDRGGPDALRRDGIGGAWPAVFRVRLARGCYTLLLVAGDPAEPTATRLACCGQIWSTGPLPAGGFEARRLTFLLERDGEVDFTFGPDGLPWRVNALLLNWRPV